MGGASPGARRNSDGKLPVICYTYTNYVMSYILYETKYLMDFMLRPYRTFVSYLASCITLYVGLIDYCKPFCYIYINIYLAN